MPSNQGTSEFLSSNSRAVRFTEQAFRLLQWLFLLPGIPFTVTLKSLQCLLAPLPRAWFPSKRVGLLTSAHFPVPNPRLGLKFTLLEKKFPPQITWLRYHSLNLGSARPSRLPVLALCPGPASLCRLNLSLSLQQPSLRPPLQPWTGLP